MRNLTAPTRTRDTRCLHFAAKTCYGIGVELSAVSVLAHSHSLSKIANASEHGPSSTPMAVLCAGRLREVEEPHGPVSLPGRLRRLAPDRFTVQHADGPPACEGRPLPRTCSFEPAESRVVCFAGRRLYGRHEAVGLSTVPVAVARSFEPMPATTSDSADENGRIALRLFDDAAALARQAPAYAFCLVIEALQALHRVFDAPALPPSLLQSVAERLEDCRSIGALEAHHLAHVLRQASAQALPNAYAKASTAAMLAMLQDGAREAAMTNALSIGVAEGVTDGLSTVRQLTKDEGK